MAAIGRDPGESTMIRIDMEAHGLLSDSKIIPQEPYNDCIKRLVRENQRLKKLYFTTQTKERMEAEIKNFVLNPEVPDTIGGSIHREIWQKAHPEYILTQDDIIHHINGNHDDNRIENLQKVTAKEHAVLHAKMTRDLGMDPS
jgi:hypothetical protein